MALAGNKNDMYENEEVEESEGKKLAQELGAIFQKTSAKNSTGVEDLFIKKGKKFIKPNLSVGGENPKVDKQDKGQKLKKVDEKGKGKKKKCC